MKNQGLNGTPQLKRGQNRERELDDLFSGDWLIAPMPVEWEQDHSLGDRIFVSRTDPQLVQFVEYKSDESATRTRNLFIETIAVDSTGKPGWALTCKAHYLFYYLPLEPKILIFRPDTLRDNLEAWKEEYQTKSTGVGKNSGYKSWGVLVPIEVAEACACKVVNLP